MHFIKCFDGLCKYITTWVTIRLLLEIIGPLFEQPVASLLPPTLGSSVVRGNFQNVGEDYFFYAVGSSACNDAEMKCALIKRHFTLGEFVNSAWPDKDGFGNNPDAHLETIVDHSDSCSSQVLFNWQIRNWPLNSWLFEKYKEKCKHVNIF